MNRRTLDDQLTVAEWKELSEEARINVMYRLNKVSVNPMSKQYLTAMFEATETLSRYCKKRKRAVFREIDARSVGGNYLK